MANTRNAQLRYRVLDRCFRNHLSPKTFKELKEEIDSVMGVLDSNAPMISDRTLREDIRFMRAESGFGANIKTRMFPDGMHRYYYEKPNFSIFKSNISEKDYNTLQSTIDMLGRYRGLPSTAWLEEVITNLEYRFDLKVNHKTLVSFEQNSELKGLEHLSMEMRNELVLLLTKLDLTKGILKDNDGNIIEHPIMKAFSKLLTNGSLLMTPLISMT